MDKLKLMKTFMLIVEEGSIVQAAKSLGITKAAASKQLIDLENSLNTQLLQRTTRSLKLTDAGQSFYQSAKRIFMTISEAEFMITHTHEKPSGVLRITSHRYFGERYIVNNLKEFIKLYPDLKIDLELADRFPDLEKENIDVLCGVGHEGPDYLVRKKVLSTYHILCASLTILRIGIHKTPNDLKQHRYITHSFRNPDNLLVFSNHKEVYLDYHIRVNDAQAMLRCALQGLGIAKIYDYFVEESIRKGELVELLQKYREPQKSLYVFYQQHKFVQPKIRLFLDFLYEKVTI